MGYVTPEFPPFFARVEHISHFHTMTQRKVFIFLSTRPCDLLNILFWDNLLKIFSKIFFTLDSRGTQSLWWCKFCRALWSSIRRHRPRSDSCNTKQAHHQFPSLPASPNRPCLAAPPWHHPPPRARAFRRRRPPFAPRGSEAGRRPHQEAHLRGAHPPRTPRPATNAAAGKPRSVPLVASGGSSARRSLPCPPRGGGFHRRTPLPPLPEVFVAFTNLTLLNFWRK
jgi:hypothetical protein